MRKFVLFVFLLTVSHSIFAQKTNQYLGGKNTNVIVQGSFSADSSLKAPKDTIASAPNGSFVIIHDKVFVKDTVWKQLIGDGSNSWGGIVGTLSAQADLQAALDAKQNAITTGTSSQYIKGNLALGNFNSDVQTVTSSLYAPLSHSHTASDISDFTTATRNTLSAGSGISYNPSTGTISATAATTYSAGYGLSEASGVFKVDTSQIATRLRVQQVADSLGALMGTGSVTQSQLDDTAAAIRADFPSGLASAKVDSVTINSATTVDTVKYWVNGTSTIAGYIDRKDGLIDGGIVTWSGSGLTFDVTAAIYRLSGSRYTSGAGQITLDAADATNPRIDVIAVDSTGAIVKITGDAAVNPVQPQIDPSTQIYLTSVQVAAGATTPTGVSTGIIYDENTEWTTSTTGSITVDFNATTAPQHGTKHISVTSSSSSARLVFTNGTTLSSSNYSALKIYVQLNSIMLGNQTMYAQFYNSGSAVSSAINLAAYGLSRSTTGSYQAVAIPVSAFSFTGDFDNLKIWVSPGSGSYYLDNIQLQAGITQPPPTSTGLTNAYAVVTDGTNNAVASGSDKLKLRSADNKLSISVTNNDATHGDNALFTINQSNLTLAQSQITGLADSLAAIRTTENYNLIYDSSSWNNLAGFIVNGATVSSVSNKISFSGGTGTFTQTLGVRGATAVDKWTMTAKVKVGSKTSTSYGFGVGKKSINTFGSPSTVGRFDMSTGSAAGKIILNGGGANTQLAISADALSFSEGDYILIRVERDGYSLSVSARNVTTNSTWINASYTYATAAGAEPYIDNTGLFSIYSFGGSFTLDSLNLQSKASKHAALAIRGDSKTIGYDATSQSKRLSDLLNATYRSTVNLSGGFDRTKELSASSQEVINLLPKQLILNIGSNDIRQAIEDTATIFARYDSCVTAFTNAGIDVWHIVMYESSVDLSGLVNHILWRYPTKYIDVYDAMKEPGCLAADNVHPNDYGNSVAYNAIVSSAKLMGASGKYYTDEQAQDAVGAMVSNEFTYNDATPSLAINAIAQSKITNLTTDLAAKIDSLKRSSDSVYARKGDSWIYQYKDSVGAGGGSSETLVKPGNADYTATAATQSIVYETTLTGNRTLTIPAASGNTGVRLTIKNAQSADFAVLLSSVSSILLDGASVSQVSKGDWISILSDGTSWYVVASSGKVGSGVFVLKSFGTQSSLPFSATSNTCTYTLPANSLTKPGDRLVVKFWFKRTGGSDNLTINFRFATTTIVGKSSTSYSTAGNEWVVELTYQDSTTTDLGQALNSSAGLASALTFAAVSSIDWRVANDFKITFTTGATTTVVPMACQYIIYKE